MMKRVSCATAPLRRAGVSLAGASLLLCSHAQTTNQPLRVSTPRKPNIIFILADDLGYGDLGCYGQARIKTPNLDKLAAEGMRFTSFYAGSTVCAPSRCALMTGLHTGHSRIRANDNTCLQPGDFTVARLLHPEGYFAGLIGKWGLGNENTPGMPQKQGFDEFVGYLDQTHAHDYYTDHLWRYRPGRADGTVAVYDDWERFPENQGRRKGLYIPDLFLMGVTNFVRIHKPDPMNGNRPFFLYWADTIPHANNEEGRQSGNGMQVPTDTPYSSESWPQVEKNKAAMITLLDTHVGQLMARLKEMNLEQDTIVFFSSDNGPHKEGGVDPDFFRSGGPLRGIKRDLYEGGIRVPLIVRWPGHIKPGQTTDLPFAFWDFLPTVAEVIGAGCPKGLDGISFLPTLLGQAQTNRHEFLYWEFHERGFQQAVRMGDWKEIRLAADKPLELYDLKSDLGEKRNVASEHPDAVAKIEEYLKKARSQVK